MKTRIKHAARCSLLVWILIAGLVMPRPTLVQAQVHSFQKISATTGNFTGHLDDNDQVGGSVAFLGDLDGDGVNDLAMGGERDDDGGFNRGAVWILFLNADGTVKAHQKISDTEGNFTGILDDSDEFGVSMTGLADLNGDGVDDLVVGANQDDDGGSNRGAVWVLFLNADGTVDHHQKISDTEGNFTGNLDNEDRFGRSVAALGDLDNDGVGDLAVGAYFDDDGGFNRGAVWILFLNADGTVKAQQKISATAGSFTGILDNSDEFGIGVTGLGDLNNDGVLDLAVGADRDDDGGADRGAVWILFLNPDGTLASHQKISDTEGNFTGTLDNADFFGVSVAPYADLDNNGTRELIVGAPLDDDGGPERGAIWMLFLNPDGTVASHQKISDTEGNFTGNLDNTDFFGISAVSLGDLDNDGTDEIAVGAVLDDDADIPNGGNDQGAVWMLFLEGAASGTITGTVTDGTTPLQGVTVKLLDDMGLPVAAFDDQLTNALGQYSFIEVPAGTYQIMIVEPLGYSTDTNPKETTLEAGAINTIDFVLTAFILVNDARSKGYWKHQFDVHVQGRGNAQESEADLLAYIADVETRYTSPHFQTIFADMADGTDDFEEWQDVLSTKKQPTMEERAKAQLGALVLNVMSLKIAQYEVVTVDGRDVGDVVTYVSELIENGDASDDELAKDLAEQVNEQETIAAGVVPDGDILYKAGPTDMQVPERFALHAAYPNPFNPQATIRFEVPEASTVRLVIYDALGRQVDVLVDGMVKAGRHSVVFEASALPSGVYLYQLETPEGSFAQTVQLVK